MRTHIQKKKHGKITWQKIMNEMIKHMEEKGFLFTQRVFILVALTPANNSYEL